MGLALLGSLFFALGAALQQYEAAATARATRSLLRTLLVRPRWLLGGVSIVAGGGLHILALGFGPLTVVQPLGVTSLLFALPIAALLHRRPVSPAELGAAAMVVAGLTALVWLVPAPQTPPRLADREGLLLLACAAALALAAYAAAHRLRVGRGARDGGGGPGAGGRARTGVRHRAEGDRRAVPSWRGRAARAGALAGAAGVMFGATSTFVRVLADAVGRDPWALLHWFTVAAVAAAAAAMALLQSAYAVGHFAVAFAAVQVADPVTAFTAGGLLAGDPLPVNAGGAVAAALLCGVGTVALARTTPFESPDKRRDRCPHP